MPEDNPAPADNNPPADNNLSVESATKLLESKEKILNDYNQGVQDSLAKEVESWKTEIKNDADIGGKNYEQTEAFVTKGLKEFAGEEFTTLLENSGYRYNPHVVKMFRRLGELVSNDPKGILSNNPSSSGGNDIPASTRMYAKTTSEQIAKRNRI